MRSESASSVSVKQREDMLSLEKRLESRVLAISKDMLSLRSHIVSQLSRIDISLAAISRSQQAMLDLISDIARKMESSENLAKSQSQQLTNLETNLLKDSEIAWSKEDTELLDSLMKTPEHGTFQDITCSETFGLYNDPLKDPIFQYGGFVDLLELGSPERPTKKYKMDI